MLTVLLAILIASPACAQNLLASDTFPIDHPTVRAVAFMDELVQARTGGRIGIMRRAGGKRDSDSFVIGQVRNGSLDMARVNLAALNGAVPDSVLPTLPFVFKSPEHMRRTLDGPVGHEILASLEPHGLIGLCFYDGGTRSFYSRSGPIRSVNDLKGLKVGVQAIDGWGTLLWALGATPVMVPMAQMRAALQAGVVDAADGDWATYVAQDHHSVAPFYSLTAHSQPPSVLIFSQRTWRTLSAADQELLREAALKSVGGMRDLMDGYQAAARRRAERAGVSITEDVHRMSFIKAMVPLYSRVLDEPYLLDVMSRIQADQ